MFKQLFHKVTILQAFSFLLLVAFVFNTGGYWLLYWGMNQHYYQKHLILEKYGQYDEETLEVLTFAKERLRNEKVGLEWEEKKEFAYKGGMYDVVKKTHKEDSVQFLVKRDHEEEKLQKWAANVKQNQDNATKQQDLGLLGWFKLVITQAQPVNPLKVDKKSPPCFFSIPYLNDLFDTYLSVEKPPPVLNSF